MNTYVIQGTRGTLTADGWHGTRQLPTFTVEATGVREAATKASEILTDGGGGYVHCTVRRTDKGTVHVFDAAGGVAVGLQRLEA